VQLFIIIPLFLPADESRATPSSLLPEDVPSLFYSFGLLRPHHSVIGSAVLRQAVPAQSKIECCDSQNQSRPAPCSAKRLETGSKTANVTKDAANDTGKAAEKTGHSLKKGVKGVGHVFDKDSSKTEGAPK
jgi:hypothetical protein